MTTTATRAPASSRARLSAPAAWPLRLLDLSLSRFERIPHTLIAFIARFSIAAVFWSSGQTKVQGFALNIVSGEFMLGWPRLSDSALADPGLSGTALANRSCCGHSTPGACTMPGC